MNKLWEQREWLTSGEAARYLSSKMGSSVSQADVFRLAIEGHLALSVQLPASVEATCQEGVGTKHRARKRIDGLWELVMQGAGRLEAESIYRSLRGLPYVHVDGSTGASVTRDGVVYQLPPDPGVATGIAPRRASALPSSSLIVVRMEALTAFVAKIPAASADAPADSSGGAPAPGGAPAEKKAERTAEGEDRSWTDVRIEFTSEEQVQVTVNGNLLPAQNYADLGFEDRRSKKATKAWEALQLLAKKHGVWKPDLKERRRFERRIQEIRPLLRQYLQRQGYLSPSDDPLPCRNGEYTAAFTIGLRPSFGAD